MKNTILIFLSIFFVFFYTSNQYAKEILIYADNIYYDNENNLVAKGNAKIISENEIIISNLIIYKKSLKKIILPTEFSYKDKKGNYYFGSSGNFNSNLNKSKIENVKILLTDGSRIVGQEVNRDGNIDIISKGVYSPCTSRISIKNYVCPIWQLDGEKILHDTDKLLLYQKHSKMRLFNIPVFYLPYMVSPSPLRKKRKSGFLNPSINFDFLDTKVSQNITLPYYFNLDIDKELFLTPTINYGGGADSSQRFLFDYNQLISGGNLDLLLTIDTKLENQNNEKWFQNGSIITNYNQNLNEKYFIDLNSTIQSSRNYIQKTDQNNKLSYASSLSSTIDLYGYGIKKYNDELYVNFSTYQASQSTQNNKTIPKVLPFINYTSGEDLYSGIEYNNTLKFYNIVREENTLDHAEKQQKISHSIKASKEIYKYKSKFTFNSNLYNQLFITKNKKIDNINVSSNYYRIFPIIGAKIDVPMEHVKTKIKINPSIQFISSIGQSNSNKISNEESTNNSFHLNNQNLLNRYNGNDQLDNSKRIVYSLNLEKKNINFNFSQYYELTNNSNYHYEVGNSEHLSDALATISYSGMNTYAQYETRYAVSSNKINRNKINLENNNFLGLIELTYLNEKKETNNLSSNNNEVITYNFESNKFKKFNSINIKGLYNGSDKKNSEYSIGYNYFDECFGISIDFKRNDYFNDNVKPKDILSIMFSFKNLGSYKSTNLAVSEEEKQEIRWESKSISNEQFN